MKSYTNLEQSKVLAEILHPESADFCWGVNEDNIRYNKTPWTIPWRDYTAKNFYLPCWSLAALLTRLYETITTDDGDFDLHIFVENGGYHVQYDDNYEGKILVESGFQEYLMDAAYEVVLKLNELKLL